MNMTEYSTGGTVPSVLTTFFVTQFFPNAAFFGFPNVVKFGSVTTVSSPPGLALGLLIYTTNKADQTILNAAMRSYFATPATRNAGVQWVISYLNNITMSATALTDFQLDYPA